MDRRDLLVGVSAVATVAVAKTAFGASPQPHQHMHGKAKYEALMDAASHCVSTGELCLDHCHEVLATGDKSLGECAKSVNELIAVCTALRSLSAQESKFLPKYAKLTMEVCKSCEAECRKVEKNHPVCKDCADSCTACAKECDRIPT